jgi:3',5'-cyclic AMP phosphodiesterase CpdA
MPVYGCVGNHDAYHASARNDQLGILPSLFPAGRTHYTFTKSPLRFIVLDASYWRTPDGGFTETYSRGETRGIGIKPEQIDWLRQTLSADTTTPTVVVSHYPFFNEGGESSCGYMLSAHRDNQILDILSAAPNVVATLNGHTHWNSVDRVAGISCIQNAAFVEWPSMYRVFRVYDDALRWEVRLARNFGFVRESFIPAKALSWMISTGDGDLAGTVALERVP